MNIYWAPTLYVPASLFHVLEIQPFQSPRLQDLKDTYNKPKKKRKMMLDMPEC